MTTGTNRDVDPVARRRAAELLGVEEDASCVEARFAYFRQLPEWDFVPPLSLRQALRVLEGKGVSAELDEQWLREDEDRLRADIEAFAAEFFALPVPLRRERWEALHSRCRGVSPLAARLVDLTAGLAVEVSTLPSGESFPARLVEHLLHSFPRSSLARATARQELLREIEASSADHPSWEKAARYIQAKWPALAALDGKLVLHIAQLSKCFARRSKMHRRSQRQREATPAASGDGTPWWVVPLIFVVLGGVVRSFKTSNDSPSPRAPFSGYAVPPDGGGFPTHPPIADLLNPAKYDVESVGSASSRILSFRPRLGSSATGPKGARPNDGPPLMFGETALVLMGVSKEQMNTLRARARAGKRPDGTLKTPPGEGGASPAKSTKDDKTRP